jgi:hypothetical protein
LMIVMVLDIKIGLDLHKVTMIHLLQTIPQNFCLNPAVFQYKPEKFH